MRIGIIDDDEDTLRFVGSALASNGHNCLEYRSGADIIAALQRETFDLLVVDWNMPGVSGMDVLNWAQSHIEVCPPIVMLTGRAEKEDIAAGLNAGADDFIVKPETASVIKARVEAVLRRTVPRERSGRFETFGRYVFDRATDTVAFEGATVALTSKEFALAQLLFVNQDRPLSRSYIFESVWKTTIELSTRTLDMHVSRIRAKLQLRAENGYRLQTIFGYGYRLEAPSGPSKGF